jgi:hypothetical protein
LEQLAAAAGGKLVAMYGKTNHGPGSLIIIDVPDSDMAAAWAGVGFSAGTVQNVEMTRLYTMEELASVRQKASRLRSAYKPPGQL